MGLSAGSERPQFAAAHQCGYRVPLRRFAEGRERPQVTATSFRESRCLSGTPKRSHQKGELL